MPQENHFDAIVIGSGISGGWAAKELCEHGLKTLVLERGRDVEHIKDYPTATKNPWEFEHRGSLTKKWLEENPLITKAAGYDAATAHFFIKDKDHPYIQEKPFDWIRGYQVGGKSLTWGRACQRWSKYEFTAPAKYGYGIEWPISYDEIAPWYSHAELFVGVCGHKDGIDAMPDGEFLPPFDFNCVESHVQQTVSGAWKDRHVVRARWAHLTEPKQVHLDQGRGRCQARNLCMRGCPLGGYFSSVSATLPWAKKTGNLTVRPHSVVHSIIYDEQKGKATGVRVIDAQTKQAVEYFARIIFVNASALNSNLILLNSTSSRFPNGFGNDNGLLGKYIAFHNYRARVSGSFDGFADSTTKGRRPTSGYIPRFRNLYKQETDFLRGYAAGFSAGRSEEQARDGLGLSLKEALAASKLGPWRVGSHMMGETIPKETNHVGLDAGKTDEWGMPLLKISVDYDDNDEKMVADYLAQLSEMFEKAGFTDIRTSDSKQAPGLDIHEMGGVRMGHDPKTSLLNKWNQMHACKNVFVTDGACMTSTSTQNPSLTYMALSARAVDYAVKNAKT